MKAANRLSGLIKVLKPSEKKFFRLFYSRDFFSLKEKNDSKYFMLLFDAIESQKDNDAEKAERNFSGKTKIKQIHPVRNYLYNHLLSSLVYYHTETSSGTLIRNLIDRAEILFRKTLFLQAAEVLEKANSIAERYEEWEAIPWIKHWEMKIALRSEVFGKVNNAIIHHTESKAIMEKLQLLHRLENLRQAMHNEVMKKGWLFFEKTPMDIDREMKFVLKLNADKYNSFRIKKMIHTIRALYYNTEKKFSEAEQEYEKTALLYMDFPFFIENDPQEYFRVMRNSVIYKGIAQKLSDSLQLVRKLREQSIKTFSGKEIKYPDEDLFFLNNTEIYFLVRTGLFHDADRFLREWLLQDKKWEKKLNEENRMLLIYNIIYIHFALGRFTEALKWSNKIIRSRMAPVRQDIDIATRLLNLMIHYELKNFDYLPYAVRSTSRYIKMKDHLFKTEIIMTGFFKKVPVLYTENRLRETLKELVSTFHQMLKDPEGKDDIEYFDFLLPWLESKTTKKSFASIVRNKWLKEHPDE